MMRFVVPRCLWMSFVWDYRLDNNQPPHQSVKTMPCCSIAGHPPSIGHNVGHHKIYICCVWNADPALMCSDQYSQGIISLKGFIFQWSPPRLGGAQDGSHIQLSNLLLPVQSKSFVTMDFPSWSCSGMAAGHSLLLSACQPQSNPFPICANCINTFEGIEPYVSLPRVKLQISGQTLGMCKLQLQLSLSCMRCCGSVAGQHESIPYIMGNCCGYGCYPLELCP